MLGAEPKITERAYAAGELLPPAAFSFIREVASLYHRNFWLFFKTLLPAAAFGYFLLFIAIGRANDIVSHLPRGLDVWKYHKSDLVEATVLRFGGFIADWVIYSFAFAAVVVAVQNLDRGEQPEIEEGFNPARDRLGSFLRLSLALWAICALAVVICSLVFGLLLLKLHPKSPFRDPMLLGFAIIFPGVWVVSRFGLAIPALLLEKIKPGKALFRSDELTKSCWTILALLLIESVGGSYLTIMLPQWLVWEAVNHGLTSAWVLNAAMPVGLLFGIVLQPHMLIGFSLLYLRRADQISREGSGVVTLVADRGGS